MRERVIEFMNEAMTLVWCDPGTYTMGSSPSESGRWIIENQHQVQITTGFWIGKYPVTQRQWNAVSKSGVEEQFGKGCSDPTVYRIEKKMLRFEEATKSIWKCSVPDPRPHAPVYYVNWYEAVNFCKVFGKISGCAARLPTEAEWEYACRADTSTATYNGDLSILGQNNAPVLDAIAWYAGNCVVGYPANGSGSPMWHRSEMQHPGIKGWARDVGQKHPNQWGIFDTIGNVFEWCNDWYAPYGDTITDPQGAPSGESRIVRGGSWFHLARASRAANRGSDPPGYRAPFIGFRVAVSGDVLMRR